ncbi:MAG: hypothetical protein J6U86_01040, partial [Clostridia bacterium]|nr:hypothetical protein [Clostridia bacterium]
MKSFVKRLGIILLVLCMLLVGCRKTDQETVTSIDLNGYKLIRGEDESPDMINAISKFYFTLKNDYKLDVTFGVDTDIAESEKEILFGTTNRSTDKNHRYSDYSIEYKDGKIYISAGSDEAITAAAKFITEQCISENGVLSLEKIPYEYKTQYSMEALKVFGIELNKFSVVEIEGDADDTIRKWLGSRTGMRRVSEEEYFINVVLDPTLNLDEISIKLVGKELLLAASEHYGDLTLVTDYFLKAIKTKDKNSDNLTFDEVITVEIPENTTLSDIRDVTASTKMVYGETDKDPLGYKVGDNVVFICSLYADGKLVSCPTFSWIAKTADGKTYLNEASGSHGKLVVKVPATAAGVIRLDVSVVDEDGVNIFVKNKEDTSYKQDSTFSVVVNASEVTTTKSEPADFDSFWATQVAELNGTAPDVISMEKVTNVGGVNSLDGAAYATSGHDFYRVTIQMPDGFDPAVGYLTIPKGVTSAGITVVFEGYGVRDLTPYISPSDIVLNVCAHSYELGREASYYKNLAEGALENYGFTNTDRDKVYFKNMILRDLQAVRFIKAYAGTTGVSIEGGANTSLGKWNGKLRTYGQSQGGFQGIAVAALDKDVTDGYWISPWLCDIGGT